MSNEVGSDIPTHSNVRDYPATIALAYLILCSYVTSRVFVALHLPGAVGTILVGFGFSFFIQEEVYAARDELQELAFFLVLLTAGFEIALPDLNLSVILMAWIPVALEIVGISMTAMYLFDWCLVECLCMACTVCGLGDGLVIPKMKAFMQEFPSHPLPRFMFTWGPLEASFVLTVFGVLTPLAHPEGEIIQRKRVALLANVLIIISTLMLGIVLGTVAGWALMNRTKLVINKRQVFTGHTVEAYLIVLSVALVAFGCGQVGHHSGQPFIPIMFSPGSLFQPELLVIVTGCAFGAAVDDETLHGIEAIAGGVWVFGQLFLYSILGSKTDLSVFKMTGQVLPIVIMGTCSRFLGVTVMYAIVRRKMARPRSAFWQDVLFMFVSTLPRATLQGALGSVPKRKKFFGDMPQKTVARDYISVAARIYIALFAIGGSILVDTVGKSMLKATLDVNDNQPMPTSFKQKPLFMLESFQLSPAASSEVDERRRAGSTPAVTRFVSDASSVGAGVRVTVSEPAGAVGMELPMHRKTTH